MKKKQRQNKTVLDRQYKGGHGVNWTDTEENNGLDKGPTTFKVMFSYPSPPSGWRKELMMTLVVVIARAILRHRYVDPIDSRESYIPLACTKMFADATAK